MGQGKKASTLGRKGEEIAERFLRAHGFEIKETRYRFGHGEIDIIAFDMGILVFCEVKTRMSDRFGEPELALTRGKQQQIRKIAEAYLYERNIIDQVCRFDVIAIMMRGELTEIRHYRDAF